MAVRSVSQRQRILTVTALLVISIWVVVSWLGLPRWEQVMHLRNQARLSETKLKRLQALLERKPVIERAAQRYAGFWSGESEEFLQGAFLDELEQMAQAGGVHLNLKPRPIERQEQVTRLGVELEVDGTQQALMTFLDKLLAWPSLMELDRLRIATTASKDTPLRATLLINKVVIRR